MKFPGKMNHMIILKITKNQGFNLSLEDRFFGKPQRGHQIDPRLPPGRFRVKLLIFGFLTWFLLKASSLKLSINSLLI